MLTRASAAVLAQFWVKNPKDWDAKREPSQFRIAFLLQRAEGDANVREDTKKQECFHEARHACAARRISLVKLPRADRQDGPGHALHAARAD